MKSPHSISKLVVAWLAVLCVLLMVVGCDSSSPAPQPAKTNSVALKATNSLASATNVVLVQTNSIFDDSAKNARNPFFMVVKAPEKPAGGPDGKIAIPFVAPPEIVLVLNGIMGGAKQRVALINGRTFLAGDEATIRSGESQIQVLCVEIGAQYAVVKVDGKPEPRKLMLKRSTKGSGN